MRHGRCSRSIIHGLLIAFATGMFSALAAQVPNARTPALTMQELRQGLELPPAYQDLSARFDDADTLSLIILPARPAEPDIRPDRDPPALRRIPARDTGPASGLRRLPETARATLPQSGDLGVLADIGSPSLVIVRELLETRMRDIGIDRIDTIPGSSLLLVRANRAQFLALAADPAIARIEENLPLDLNAQDTTSDGFGRELRTAIATGASYTIARGATGRGQVIAIIDSGVRATHDWFRGETGSRVIAEACFSHQDDRIGARSQCPGGGLAEVGPGTALPCAGFDLPGCSHGTHVAGIAAGADQDRPGVAPEASIFALAVTSIQHDTAADRSCARRQVSSPCAQPYTSSMLAALGYIRNQHVSGALQTDVVNLSIGGAPQTGYCDSLLLAEALSELASLGIDVVAAAGNDGFNYGVDAPACARDVVAVSAAGRSAFSQRDDGRMGDLSLFSNWGETVDLIAPGETIVSAIAHDDQAVDAADGTSMAAPMVAGAFAAFRQYFGDGAHDYLDLFQTHGGVTRFNRGVRAGEDPVAVATRPALDLKAAFMALDTPREIRWGSAFSVRIALENDLPRPLYGEGVGTALMASARQYCRLLGYRDARSYDLLDRGANGERYVRWNTATQRWEVVTANVTQGTPRLISAVECLGASGFGGSDDVYVIPEGSAVHHLISADIYASDPAASADAYCRLLGARRAEEFRAGNRRMQGALVVRWDDVRHDWVVFRTSRANSLKPVIEVVTCA